MGIKERQERDREALRRAILDAARDLFVTEGYQHVTMRKIAERIEYSPAAIYSYFPSKDDIFFALAEEGFRLLGDPTFVTGPDERDPVERIRTIFWRVHEFSREHPQYFGLMFIDRSVPRINREWERFAFVHQMKARVIAQVQHCIDAGRLPRTLDPMVAIHLLMSSTIGVVASRMADRLGSDEDADHIARTMLDVVLAGLAAGAARPSPASPEAPPTSPESKSEASFA